MPHELAAALSLVLVIEGLLLFAAPGHWQAVMRQAFQLSPRTLRVFGAVAVGVGLVVLRLLR